MFRARVVNTGEVVAIKKVLQDKRFKNRELQIMRKLQHPNIVTLKHCFYSNGDKPDELYLNLVLEYVPETVYRVARQYHKMKQTLPLLYVKLYMYQLCRALAHIHALGICHRDIKPQNLLVDPVSHKLMLCDFGSAKILVKGEPNVSYICSRYYRAPELIFGSTEYTTAIDMWSLGCVAAELLLGQPLFPGESGVDQLVEIIKCVVCSLFLFARQPASPPPPFAPPNCPFFAFVCAPGCFLLFFFFSVYLHIRPPKSSPRSRQRVNATGCSERPRGRRSSQ